MIDLITTFIIKLFLHDITALQLRTLFAFFLGKYVFFGFLAMVRQKVATLFLYILL